MNTKKSKKILGKGHSKQNKKPSYCWDSQPSVAIFRT